MWCLALEPMSHRRRATGALDEPREVEGAEVAVAALRLRGRGCDASVAAESETVFMAPLCLDRFEAFLEVDGRVPPLDLAKKRYANTR